MDLRSWILEAGRVRIRRLVVPLAIAAAALLSQPSFAQEKAVADAQAQFELGSRYEQGKGVPQNYSFAAEWYARAAEQGHADARRSLVELYRSNHGVPVNTVDALKWVGIEEASAIGDRKAALATLLTDVAQTMTSGEIAVVKALAGEWIRRMGKRSRSVRSLDISTLLALEGGIARRGAPDVYVPGVGGVSEPRLLHEEQPSYTRDAMGAMIQGRVVLECIVETDGRTRECLVLRSLDAKHGLDTQAIKAAYRWRFDPAQKDGRPVAVTVTMEFSFTLK